jgi:cell division protein ZapD
MQRSSIPGGSCNFDLPQYHYWLNQPHEIRQTQMDEWLRELSPVREAVMLLLNLVRGSTIPSKEQAPKGFFQKSFDSSTPAQMLRVGLPKQSPLFVEISGNKHRFSIRFLEAVDTGRPLQTTNTVDFQLTSCIF